MKPAQSIFRYLYQCRHRLLLALMVIIGICTFLPLAASAQSSYPQRTSPQLNDYASLLSNDEANEIHAIADDLWQQHNVELVVLTINSIHDYNTPDTTIEAFATHLFNTWQVGSAETNRGVLLIVAVKDRKMRIELGAGYDASYNSRAQAIIDNSIVPHFREEAYGAGIVAGAQGIAEMVTGTTSDTASSSIDAPPPVIEANRPSSDSSGIPSGLLFGGGAAAIGGIAFFGIRQYQRYRPRRCPQCSTQMSRLDEYNDDVYLESGQKLEEVLGSINYDVWKCSSCNQHDVLSYRTLFSSLRDCPKCGYRTMNVTSTILEEATYDSTGRKELRYNCNHCSYHDSDVVVIPRRTRPSSSSSSGSSSSGSSSGGRSSGGGASGSW